MFRRTPRRRLLAAGAAAASLTSTLVVFAGMQDASAAGTHTWDGNGGDSNWTTAGNWDSVPAPGAGDDLVFPLHAGNEQPNNDFGAGGTFNSISVLDNQYQLVGNAVETPSVTLTNPDPIDCGNLTQTGFQMGNGGTGLIVPNGGTTTINVNGPGQAFISTQVDTGADDLAIVLSGDGNLRGNLQVPTAAAGHAVTRSGGGLAAWTSMSGAFGPTVPVNYVNAGGTTIFDENTTFQVEVTATGGEVGGRGFLTSYTGDGGTLSPSFNSCSFAAQPTSQVYGDLELNPGSTFRVDMTSSSTFDRLFVQDNDAAGPQQGTVDITGSTLSVNASGFIPAGGQNYGIIVNDLADPVVGTFAGLADGATVNVGGVDMTIRYNVDSTDPALPAGNDVVLTTGPAFVWDGNGGNGLWSNDANWVGGVAPEGITGTETLNFPNLADPGDVKATTNDVGGTFKDIVVDAAQYSFAGQPITLSGNYTGNNGADTNTFTADVTFTGGGSIQLPNAGAGVTFNGTVDAGGATLTLSGFGNFTLAGPLANGQLLATAGAFAFLSGTSPAFAGPVTVDATGRGAIITGSLAQAELVGNGTSNAFYSGNGSVDGITATAGTLSPDDLGDVGTLTSTDGLALSGDAVYGWEVNGVNGDTLAVTGTVDVTGSILTAARSSSGVAPVPGTSHTIISNDGADAVTGTFRYDDNVNDANPPVALPDGSVVLVDGIPLTIDYSAGTGGNDVVLAAVNADVWDGSEVSANWSVGANWVDGSAPTAGATLIFPETAGHKADGNNDLAIGFADISFTGATGGYTLGGNTITLSGNINNNSTSGANAIAADVTFTGGGIVTGPSGATFTFTPTSAVDLGGAELVLEGRQVVNLSGTFSNGQIDADFEPGGFGGAAVLDTDQTTLSGGVEVDEGAFVFSDDIGPGGLAVHTGGSVSGDGTVSGAIANDGGFIGFGGVAKGVITGVGGFSQTAGGLSFRIDGSAAGTFDQLVISSGPVTIGGTLNLSTAVTPPFGAEVPIIRVPGVVGGLSGAFSNAADGATVVVSGGGPSFDGVIDYTGGDGNDVTITFPPTFTWDGGAPTDQMTLAANWVNDVAPQPGQGHTLVFPDSATSVTPVNDFPAGSTFEAIRFTGGSQSYSLTGNEISLTEDLVLESGFTNQIVTAPLDLAGGGSITSGAAGVLIVDGGIDAGANTLTLDGGGGVAIGAAEAATLVKNGIGTATLTVALNNVDAITLNAGQLVVLDAAGAPIDVLGGRLQGDGTADGIDADLGFVDPGGTAAAVFTTTAGFDLAASSDLVLDVNGTAAGTDHDQLVVTSGGVVLAGDLDLNGFTPLSPGATVRIVDNQAAGAISGTFASLPEGATVLAGTQPFTISYVGGTGNDVVLTAGPVASLSDDASTIVEGDAGSTDVGLAVELDAPSTTDVVATVTATGGDAAAGTDFTLTSAVTVTAGDTSAPVVFAITGDGAPEVDETVEVTLAITSGAVLGTPSEAVVTIDDDDLSTLTVVDAVVQVVEGGASSSSVSAAATSTLTVTLDGPSEDDIDLQVATADGTATAPADYAAIATTFTIPAGSTSFVVPLAVVADGVDEPDETFLVRFLAANGGLLDVDDVTVTILDDDVVQVITTTSTTRPGGGAGSGSISRTGADSGPMSYVGLGLIAFGAGLVLTARRRRA